MVSDRLAKALEDENLIPSLRSWNAVCSIVSVVSMWIITNGLTLRADRFFGVALHLLSRIILDSRMRERQFEGNRSPGGGDIGSNHEIFM